MCRSPSRAPDRLCRAARDQDTIREKLPEGFQRAEYLHAHGMVDMVVHRPELKERLAQVLSYLNPAKAA
jgi:acetyl-CoA carboxylase carboxyl transferase subunit beta